MAETLGRLDEGAEALALFDKCIKAAPKSVKPRADKALLLQRMGDFEAAEKEFRRALRLAPKDGELYRLFLTTKTLSKGDPLIRAMEQAWVDKKVTGRGRVQLGFALAKAMEDIGASDRVFRYLNRANTEHRAANPFDIAHRVAEVDGLIEAFTGADYSPISMTSDICLLYTSPSPRD